MRIDQKSCLKAISSAGLIPIVIDNVLVGDQVCTRMDALSEAVDRLGPDSIACIVSTTRCAGVSMHCVAANTFSSQLLRASSM